MKTIEYIVPASYELILFGDNHEGNALQYRDGFLSVIDYIASKKNCFAVHMGDEIEAYWIDDPRYRPEIILNDPLAQRKQIVKALTPIKKKLITILYGNHSHRLYSAVGDVTKATCEDLDIPYSGFSAVVQFKNPKYGIQFKGFFTHGRKTVYSYADDPVRRIANMQLQLKRQLQNKFGDCLINAKGHTHKLLICEPSPRLYLITEKESIKQRYTYNPPFGKGGYIHPDHRWYINTGSFLKTFGEGTISSYSEMFEYDPVELGYISIIVENNEIIKVEKKTV